MVECTEINNADNKYTSSVSTQYNVASINYQPSMMVQVALI